MEDVQNSDMRFRSFMTFGTGPGAPAKDTTDRFIRHCLALLGPVATDVHTRLLMKDHDFSRGSDIYSVVEGVVVQCAAELWAIYRIVGEDLALLTAFHHVRAIYEAHSLIHWLFEDFDGRQDRVMKAILRERAALESAFKRVGVNVETDIAEGGAELLADESVRGIPRVADRGRTDPVLVFDYPWLYKYGSAHVHPYNIHSAEVDPRTEAMTIEQLYGGAIRHTAAVNRKVVQYFELESEGFEELLREAEEWSRYQFDVGEAIRSAS